MCVVLAVAERASGLFSIISRDFEMDVSSVLCSITSSSPVKGESDRMSSRENNKLNVIRTLIIIYLEYM